MKRPRHVRPISGSSGNSSLVVSMMAARRKLALAHVHPESRSCDLPQRASLLQSPGRHGMRSLVKGLHALAKCR